MQKKAAILMLIAIFACQPLQLKADGGMIPYNYEDLYEPSQTSLIVFDNGQEDLYLKVNYEGETNKFVWLVPTPSYPQASKAPKNIFEELSTLTSGSRQVAEWLQTKGDSEDLGEVNVIVHSQENIGIYEVTVLSATGADGLFDWLNNHGYKVSEDVKEILDWYIQKEWYFTAMRIDPIHKIEQAVEEFKKIDSTVTIENFSEKFAELAINSILEADYNKYLLEIELMNISGYDDKDELYVSKDEFLENVEEIQAEVLADLEFGKQEIKSDMERYINDLLNPGSVSKYSDYIEPIKISFKTNTIVYPLKISQMSTRVPEDNSESSKTNEILLYILSDGQVKAPGFELEYAQTVNYETINSKGLNSLKEIVVKDYFLTKIRRDFAKVEMDDDLYLIDGQNSEEAMEFEIDFFTGENCPHCDKAKSFLNELAYSHFNLKINSYEVYNNEDNKKLYQQAVAEKQIDSAGVPLVIIGNEYVLGFHSEEVTGKEIKNKIDSYLLKSLTESYEENQEYAQAKNQIQGSALSDRLKGMIVLKVEDNGEAYYINPKTKIKKYLGRPTDAFSVMREQGIGITNENLEKIQIGSSNLTGADSDSDGLPDMFEDAIGTDKNKADSDNDGYNDKAELDNGYNPNGLGRLNADNSFSDSQKGKIFLQVENNGEAWYSNPEDGKRYFLGRPADAFQVMRNLGLGISNSDFEKL